jgi:hypothetical protein
MTVARYRPALGQRVESSRVFHESSQALHEHERTKMTILTNWLRPYDVNLTVISFVVGILIYN